MGINKFIGKVIKLENGLRYFILNGGMINNQYFYLASNLEGSFKLMMLEIIENENNETHIIEYDGEDYEEKIKEFIKKLKR